MVRREGSIEKVRERERRKRGMQRGGVKGKRKWKEIKSKSGERRRKEEKGKEEGGKRERESSFLPLPYLFSLERKHVRWKKARSGSREDEDVR